MRRVSDVLQNNLERTYAEIISMAKPCVKCMDKKTVTRVIEGCLYLRDTDPYAQDIRVHELGHGHIEATISPCYGWSEVAALSPQAHADYLDQLLNPPEPTPLELLERACRSRERSTQRAKTCVRRLIKAKNLNQMLTLTYRENVTDRDTHLRNFDVFIKRVRRVIPTFEFVVTHEQQKRGAWHSHLAVHRILPVYTYQNTLVKSFTLLTHLWRSSHSSEGCCMVSPCHKGKKRRSVAYIATYLAKYIGKEIGSDVPKYGNTYSASLGRPPAAMLFRSLHSTTWPAVLEMHDLLGPDLHNQVYEKSLGSGVYYLASSPS